MNDRVPRASHSARRHARASTGVAYLEAGSGAPLVLMHGGAGSWRHWARNIDALAGAFTVYALDLPGFGDSLAPPRDIPVDDYLDIVHASIDEICGRDATPALSAFSFGSVPAAAAAARLGKRARSLSLIGPSGFEAPIGRKARVESLRMLRERLRRDPTPEEARELHRGNLAQLMIFDPTKIDEEAIALQAENVRRTRFDSRRLSWSGRLPEFLAGVRCPVKIVFGQHDASAFPSVAQRIAWCREARPDIEVELIEGCGHWAMFEAPERINALLREFHVRKA